MSRNPEIIESIDDLDPRYDKLPKWVQYEIRDLRSLVARLQQETARGPEESPVVLKGYADDGDRPLPDHARIRFVQPSGPDHSRRRNDRWIEAYYLPDRDVVEIRSDGTGRTVRICPTSTNVIEVSSIDIEDARGIGA